MNAFDYAKKRGWSVNKRKGVVNVRYEQTRQGADFNKFNDRIVSLARNVKKRFEEEGYTEQETHTRFGWRQYPTVKIKMRFKERE